MGTPSGPGAKAARLPTLFSADTVPSSATATAVTAPSAVSFTA
ncbi:hypothetical protein [Amycolatopsis sp. WAC 04182]|nr:hypothetical protein [Amycolatopsis sp. WAC 04182]